MSYVQPGVADLQARFPTFAAVPAPAIAAALTEALARVDTSWTEADYAPAILLYAAHVLTLDGQGTSAEAALAAAGALGFTTLQSGTLSIGRSPPPAAAVGAILAETTYGRRFMALLRANQPAVLVP